MPGQLLRLVLRSRSLVFTKQDHNEFRHTLTLLKYNAASLNHQDQRLLPARMP